MCVLRKGFWWHGGSYHFYLASSDWMNYPSWRGCCRSLPGYGPETSVLKQLPGPQWAKSSFRIEHGWDFRNPVPSKCQGRPRKRAKEYKEEIIIRKINERPQKLCHNRRWLKMVKNHTCCYSFWFKLFPETVRLATKEFPPLLWRKLRSRSKKPWKKAERQRLPFQPSETCNFRAGAAIWGKYLMGSSKPLPSLQRCDQ